MTQKRLLKVLVITLLVGLLPALTVVVAQGNDGAGLLGTGRLVLGQSFVPNAPAKEVTVQNTAKWVPEADRNILPSSEAEKLGLPPTAPSRILLNVKEGYEYAWPTGAWYTFDNNGGTGGDVCWDDENWIAKKGNWSAWAAGGCANGGDPNYEYYRDDMDSWMIYGPFSTQGASAGSVNFKYWNQSEYLYDYLWWCASADGSNFYCYNHTGSTNGKWKAGKLNLKSVPGYGSMLGDSSVWVAWVFTSDGSVVDDGPFVDVVTIKVQGR